MDDAFHRRRSPSLREARGRRRARRAPRRCSRASQAPRVRARSRSATYLRKRARSRPSVKPIASPSSRCRRRLKSGIAIGGKQYPVSILVKDSQSNPNRASEVANDLILKDKVDIMLVSGTPETANPGQRRVRDERDAVRLHGRPVAAVVLRQEGRSQEGLPLHIPLLLGP